jgi:hypothetical protein
MKNILKFFTQLAVAVGAISFVGVAQLAADPSTWYGVSSGITISNGAIHWQGYFINTEMNGYLDACLSSTNGLDKCPGGIGVNIIWGDEPVGSCVGTFDASVYVSGSNEYGNGDSYSSTSTFCSQVPPEDEPPAFCSTLTADQLVLACEE